MSLRLEGVSKNFFQGDAEIKVLKELRAEVKSGEVVAVLGQSGSGKSTLLCLLAGLDRPTAGQIFVSDQEISNMSEQEMTDFRGQKIGIVFQQFHLLPHLTALENVMLPLEILGNRGDLNSDLKSIELKARGLLKQMSLEHRYNHFPSQLSGGECQRVAIARALITNPEILLADEPSGNLDADTGQQVMDIFFDVVRKNKVTTVLVTHSETLAQRCDRKLFLRNGAL